MEHLRVKNMSRGVKPKKDPKTGKYLPNGKAAKAGLNKAILNVGWGRIETLLDYKSRRAGKVMLNIDPAYSSQECAACGHTHPDNRRTQASFACLSCGHTDNADKNAAAVIKKRAIELILHPGTGLSDKGVLTPPKSGIGRGGQRKSKVAKATVAMSDEPSKKKVSRKRGRSLRF